MFVLLFIIFIADCWSAEQLRLVFSGIEVKQGALVRARLTVPPAGINLPLQKLKGETISETVYVQQISPLLRKEGAAEYEAETQIIFINVPQSNNLQWKIGESEIILSWDQLTVIPTEVPKEMLWADFSAPDVLHQNWLWILALTLLLFIPYPVFVLWKKLNFKKREKLRKAAIVEEIKNCRSYDDVVTLWKKKHTYLSTFPHLENSFVDLEKVLFKIQFKPGQSEAEKSEVLNAYQKFLNETEGGFRGI